MSPRPEGLDEIERVDAYYHRAHLGRDLTSEEELQDEVDEEDEEFIEMIDEEDEDDDW